MDQRGKISAVIDVGVRENHAVDARHRKREIAVAFKRVAAASLVQAAVEQESLSCRLDVVHGSSDRLGGTPKCDLAFDYNHYTMRAAVLFLACVPALLLAQKKPVTLETMEEAARLAPQGPGNPVAWAPGWKTVSLSAGPAKLMIYDAAIGIVQRSDRHGRDGFGCRRSPHAGRIRVPSTGKTGACVKRRCNGRVRRILYSTGGDVFRHSSPIPDNWTQLTKTPSAERDPKLSPDGKSVAFRRAWDLYTLDIASKRETRLTTGGSDTLRGTLRNGGLDWVYPEELDLGTAFWWSPDSKSIAYLQFDISHEPSILTRICAGRVRSMSPSAIRRRARIIRMFGWVWSPRVAGVPAGWT